MLCVLPEKTQKNKQLVCSSVTNAKCLEVNPFQPTDTQMEASNKKFTPQEIADNPSLNNTDLAMGNPDSEVVVDNIHYTKYWQNDHENFIFHPMRFGRFVKQSLDKNSDYINSIPAVIEKLGIKLPNNGVAFYYPNYYDLGRMSGPDLMYSAISQAEILSGFTKYDQLEQTDYSRKLVTDIKNAMMFPYEQGGVELSGVAQLELPLFRSNPEIILNGWLHALVHLNSYAKEYNDQEVVEYIERNLQFFIENQDAWYDNERNISRYSDTSPHRVILDLSEADAPPTLFAVFKSKVDELSNYIVEVKEDSENKYSAFDVKINTKTPTNGKAQMTLTCSQLFDTTLVSSEPFSLSVKDGGFDPNRASPDGTGDWHKIESYKLNNDWYAADFALNDAELICGYPTNFAKYTGENYYHVYHIVALLYLAFDSGFSDDIAGQISKIAKNWWERTYDYEYKEMKDFASPQVILDGIVRGKVNPAIKDAKALFEKFDVEIK